jgi:hypothetical protein
MAVLFTATSPLAHPQTAPVRQSSVMFKKPLVMVRAESRVVTPGTAT